MMDNCHEENILTCGKRARKDTPQSPQECFPKIREKLLKEMRNYKFEVTFEMDRA